MFLICKLFLLAVFNVIIVWRAEELVWEMLRTGFNERWLCVDAVFMELVFFFWNKFLP